jgi:predicted DNA-binding transcriptional regulator
LPDQADTGSYTEFLGYYEVAVPHLSRTSSIQLPDSSQEVNKYEVKRNLTIDNFKVINAGASVEEVKKLVGQEHEYIGSGYVGNVYILESGEKVVVYFSNGVVEQIRLLEKDSYKIIVK